MGKPNPPAAPRTIVGIAWYDEIQYARLLQVADDVESMPESFEAWLLKSRTAESALRASGQQSRRIPIDVGELSLWCAKTGRPNDGMARSEYVTQRVREIQQSSAPVEKLDSQLFVALLTNSSDTPISKDLIRDHVQYLRHLDQSGKLVLGGSFRDYQGGMIVLRAANLAEASTLAHADPFVAAGAKTLELRTWIIANAENHYGE